MNRRKELEKKIANAELDIKEAEEALTRIDKECRHLWGETVSDPIHHEGYTLQGDPPGTMGIDWRGPCYIPATTKARWKRVCQKCGKVEYTTGFEEVKRPRW